jgi:hypothetical protein
MAVVIKKETLVKGTFKPQELELNIHNFQTAPDDYPGFK